TFGDSPDSWRRGPMGRPPDTPRPAGKSVRPIQRAYPLDWPEEGRFFIHHASYGPGGVYDPWRITVQQAAAHLEREIHQALVLGRYDGGFRPKYAMSQVDLVAHGTGGLVAWYHLGTPAARPL